MAAWVIPQIGAADPQHQSHFFPLHTVGQALKPAEATACNLHAQQLVLGTPTQQSAKPADTGGRLCLGCAQRT